MKTTGILSHPLLLIACRMLLGMVFVVAAIPKIANPDSFATAVEAYELMPVAAVNLAALFIPWIELICGLFLISGVYLRAGSAILGALLTLFIVAISVAILRGLNINCGCFGDSGGATVGWNKVLEDIGLLIPAWIIFRAGGGGRESENDTVNGSDGPS